MLTELRGKGGQLCQPALEGTLRCPLIVRPTSEDVVTGEIFGILEAINPRWWLPGLLNRALGTGRFRQQIFRELRIELWQKQSPFPRHLLHWDEGSTEVDVTITWENRPTTVFIEMKYGSPLSATTANNNGHGEFPADQLIRNARVGLYQTGWYDDDRLFDMHPREFVLLLLTPALGHPLVTAYRNRDRLRTAIPYAEKLSRLPTQPFIGELSYRCLWEQLQSQSRFMSQAEKQLSRRLEEYLRYKLSSLRGGNGAGHG